mmetsp:Transcript_193/g.647  ORF Transcript_193/g.647 Transcript_193/m.647 type:complete len:261 (+) Transcript_193:2889-3671(+)
MLPPNESGKTIIVAAKSIGSSPSSSAFASSSLPSSFSPSSLSSSNSSSSSSSSSSESFSSPSSSSESESSPSYRRPVIASGSNLSISLTRLNVSSSSSSESSSSLCDRFLCRLFPFPSSSPSSSSSSPGNEPISFAFSKRLIFRKHHGAFLISSLKISFVDATRVVVVLLSLLFVRLRSSFSFLLSNTCRLLSSLAFLSLSLVNARYSRSLLFITFSLMSHTKTCSDRSMLTSKVPNANKCFTSVACPTSSHVTFTRRLQ